MKYSVKFKYSLKFLTEAANRRLADRKDLPHPLAEESTPRTLRRLRLADIWHPPLRCLRTSSFTLENTIQVLRRGRAENKASFRRTPKSSPQQKKEKEDNTRHCC